MFRVSHVLKITNLAVKTWPRLSFENARCLGLPNIVRANLQQVIKPRFYSKDSSKDPPGKKVDGKGDTPCDTTKKPQKVVLKECKPVDILPCQPPPPDVDSKIPYIDECPKPDPTGECPPPVCPEEEEDKSNPYKTAILLGLLIAAATLGALYAAGFFGDKDKKPEEKKTIKKKKGKEKEKRQFIKDPLTSAEIPNEVPYLLVGGGTASFSAFRAIKSEEPTAKVLVITNESFFPYMRPPLSKEMWYNEDKESVKKLIFKQWNGTERHLYYEPEDFYIKCRDLLSNSNGGVSVARGYTVSHIDVVEKVAYLDDGHAIHYNKCLIATGATPKTLVVFEAAASDPVIADKVKLFRNIFDFEDIFDEFDESKAIAVVGGGFLGSELACALARKAKKSRKDVYQIFRENGNMGKILPEYLSSWTTDKVTSEGVKVLSNTEVIAVRSEGKKVVLMLNNGNSLKLDQVVVAVGVEPNTDMAEKSDLEVDPDLGGFLVNTELQARTDLYIAGDCACFYDAKLGRRRIEHHDHAVVTGRLAGENMTGKALPYLHQSMFWSDLGPDVGYEAIGVIDSSLPTVGVFAKSSDKDGPPKTVKSGGNEKGDGPEKPESKEDYNKGVIFYLRDDIVVGIVLWNVFNRMSIARQVLKDESKYDDLNEVAKLFNIHEE